MSRSKSGDRMTLCVCVHYLSPTHEIFGKRDINQRRIIIIIPAALSQNTSGLLKYFNTTPSSVSGVLYTFRRKHPRPGHENQF